MDRKIMLESSNVNLPKISEDIEEYEIDDVVKWGNELSNQLDSHLSDMKFHILKIEEDMTTFIQMNSRFDVVEKSLKEIKDEMKRNYS